jgi:hypothetical protein
MENLFLAFTNTLLGLGLAFLMISFLYNGFPFLVEEVLETLIFKK